MTKLFVYGFALEKYKLYDLKEKYLLSVVALLYWKMKKAIKQKQLCSYLKSI